MSERQPRRHPMARWHRGGRPGQSVPLPPIGGSVRIIDVAQTQPPTESDDAGVPRREEGQPEKPKE